MFSDDGICCIPDCSREEKDRWLCGPHLFIWTKQVGPIAEPYGKTCGISDCRKKTDSKGMCRMHSNRYKLSGNPYAGPSDAETKAVFMSCVKDCPNGWPCKLYDPMISEVYTGSKSYQYFQWDSRAIPIRHVMHWVDTDEWLPEDKKISTLSLCGQPTCVLPAHRHVSYPDETYGIASETAALVGQTRRMLKGFQPMYNRFGQPVRGAAKMWRKSGICIEDGCGKDEKMRDRCQLHYKRWWDKYRDTPPCSIDGCDDRQYSLGLCKRHYSRQTYAKNRAKKKLTNLTASSRIKRNTTQQRKD